MPVLPVHKAEFIYTQQSSSYVREIFIVGIDFDPHQTVGPWDASWVQVSFLGEYYMFALLQSLGLLSTNLAFLPHHSSSTCLSDTDMEMNAYGIRALCSVNSY